MGLMAGKQGLVMGVANDRSLAWGIAKALHGEGARLAFTYQGEALGKRVQPLAESLDSDFVIDADVTDEQSLDSVFDNLDRRWGRLDFLVHAIGATDPSALRGKYFETTRANFLKTLDISCFSFTDLARRAAPLMTGGGSLLTLTYAGAERVMPNYNVMGVAKAGLEASVRYLANDYGPRGIRVNGISAGPVRTLAGSGVSDARHMFSYQQRNSPLRRTVTIDEVGGSALYLLSDLSSGVTGEIHYVDSGYHIVSMPALEELKQNDGGRE